VGRSEFGVPVDWSKAHSDRPQHYVGRTLTGRILLDGIAFERCEFRNAVLIYAGGALPQLAGCSFVDTTFEFQDGAARTLRLLQAMSTPSSGLVEVFKASFGRLFGH